MAEPIKHSAMKYSIPAGDSSNRQNGMIPRIQMEPSAESV